MRQGNQRQAEDVGQEQADEQAEIDGRDRVEAFSADGHVDGDHSQRQATCTPPKTAQAIQGESGDLGNDAGR